MSVVNIVASLQSDDLWYRWSAVTAIILLNVLISLFASAYSEVVDDAEAQYLAFFASKAIGMIRAPDSFVYPAPFNLIEIFLVAPFELIPKLQLDTKTYAQLNRYVMVTIFFIPLSMIAFYEAAAGSHKHTRMYTWLQGENEGDEDYPETRDPDVDEDGLKISKVPFEELIKVFPDTHQSTEANIIKEVKTVGQSTESTVMNTQSIIIKEAHNVGQFTVSAIIQEMQTMKKEIRDLQEKLAHAVTRDEMQDLLDKQTALILKKLNG